MTEWEEAKKKLDDIEFPDSVGERIEKRFEHTVGRDKHKFSNYEFWGWIGGYRVNFEYAVCPKCTPKLKRQTAAMFNDDSGYDFGIAYVRTFLNRFRKGDADE